MGVSRRSRRRKTTGGGLACALCGRESREALEGQLAEQANVRVHENCLFFSPVLRQVANPGRNRAGFLMGFRVSDIEKEAKRAGRLRCSVCKEMSAGIGCCDTRCRRSFHLMCGLAAGALALFTDTFQFFCKEHAVRPDLQREMGLCSGQVPDCSICLEPAVDPPDDSLPRRVTETEIETDTAVSGDQEWWGRFERAVREGAVTHGRCCKQSWGHRECTQKYALSAGRHHCRCPLCSDTSTFHSALLAQGVWLPDRDASWELEPGAFRDMYEVVEEDASPIRQASAGNTTDAVAEAGGFDISLQPDDDRSRSRLESPSPLDSANNTNITVSIANCSDSSEAGAENDENIRPIRDDSDNNNNKIDNNKINNNKINNKKINTHTNNKNLKSNTQPESQNSASRSNSVATGKKRARPSNHDVNTNSNSSVSGTSGGSAARQHQQADIRQFLCSPGASGTTRSPTSANVPIIEDKHIASPPQKKSRFVTATRNPLESTVPVPPLKLASPVHVSSESSSPTPSTNKHNRKKPLKNVRPLHSPSNLNSSIPSTSEGTSSNTRVILTRKRSAMPLRQNNNKINTRQSPGNANTAPTNIGSCDRCSRKVVCFNGLSNSKHRPTASDKGFICVSCSL